MKNFSVVAAIIFLFAVGAFAAAAIDSSNAEIQGRQLAQKILEQRPPTNFTQNGILKIRNTKGVSTNLTFKCIVSVDLERCYYRYAASLTEGGIEWLTIIHNDNSTNNYSLYKCLDENWDGTCYTGVELRFNENTPFAHSDFWIADLGLEFFHWPEQKILKQELRRSRACTVLESTNPNPSTNGYSRVVSWIDNETLGIVHAEAYDTKGKLLKEFDPKSFKKVNGQWELQEMEIRNVQTGSRTRLEFDVKKE
jgi:hypothetical protein